MVGIIWYLANFDLFSTILGAVLILWVFIQLGQKRFKRFLNDIESGHLKYYQIKNTRNERWKDLFITPFLLIALIIILIISKNYQDIDLMTACIVLPVIPTLLHWTRKVVFHQYANGIILSESYFQNGFVGRKLRWNKIQAATIENDKLKIRTGTRTINKKLSQTDLEEIIDIMTAYGVEIENKNVAQPRL